MNYFPFEQVLEQELLVLMPDQNLSFPSSDYFKYKTMKYVMQNASKTVIIDGRNVHTIDATVAKVRVALRIFIFMQLHIKSNLIV